MAGSGCALSGLYFPESCRRRGTKCFPLSLAGLLLELVVFHCRAPVIWMYFHLQGSCQQSAVRQSQQASSQVVRVSRDSAESRGVVGVAGGPARLSYPTPLH